MIAPKATLMSQAKSMISVYKGILELTWKGQIVSGLFDIKRQRPILLKQLQWKRLGYCKDASNYLGHALANIFFPANAKQGMSHYVLPVWLHWTV